MGRPGDGCWWGDALDLRAHELGCERIDVLRADGYLSGKNTKRQGPDRRPGVTVSAKQLPTFGPPREGEGSLNDWTMTGTAWPELTRPLGRPLMWTWTELLRAFREPAPLPPGLDIEARKRALGGWSGTAFSGHRRGNEYVDTISALVLDLDAGPARAEDLAKGKLPGEPKLGPDRLRALLERLLPGIAWAAHTTVKSTTECWRWRVVVPLASGLDPRECPMLVGLLRLQLLRGEDSPLALEADVSSNENGFSRFWFVPAVDLDYPGHFVSIDGPGARLDGAATLHAACDLAGASSPELAELLKAACDSERRRHVEAQLRVVVATEKDRLNLDRSVRELRQCHVSAVVDRLHVTGPPLRVAPLPGGWESAVPATRDGGELRPAGTGDRPAWDSLRHLLGGWTVDVLALLVGETGRGKTALALQAAESAARSGAPVLYVSAEMDERELVSRLLMHGVEGPASWAAVKRGAYPEAAVAAAASRLVASCPSLYLWVPDARSRAGADLMRMARAIFETTKCAPLIIVDYVQRMVPPSGEERRFAVSELSAALRDVSRPHGLARDWPGATVLALSSVSRNAYASFTKSAELAAAANLEGAAKESGELEYDATILMCMTTDTPDDGVADPVAGRIGLLRVVKNREGPTGRVGLRFDAPRGIFREDAAVLKPLATRGDGSASREPSKASSRRPADREEPERSSDARLAAAPTGLRG